MFLRLQHEISDMRIGVENGFGKFGKCEIRSLDGRRRRSVPALLLPESAKRGRFAYIAWPSAHFHRNPLGRSQLAVFRR